MSRTNFVAAMDAVAKLKEIAAKDLGGKPDDYEIDGDEGVPQIEPVEEPDLCRGRAARHRSRRKIQRQGNARGHPSDHQGIGHGTRGHGTHRCRQGHAARAGGMPPAFAAGFVEIELDVETGQHRIIDYPERRRLRHGDPSSGPRDANQGRRGAGLRHGERSSTIVTTRRTDCRRLSGFTRRSRRPISTCRSRCTPRGRQAGSVEPARHQGHRRAAPRLRRRRAAVRDLRSARRPRVQPHAGVARHDREFHAGRAAVAQAAAVNTF